MSSLNEDTPGDRVDISLVTPGTPGSRPTVDSGGETPTMGNPLNVNLDVDPSFEDLFNAGDPFPPELESRPQDDYDSDSGGEDTFTFQRITERARRKAIEKRQRKKLETQSDEYDIYNDSTYDRDALGNRVAPATAESVMHHIVHTLLKEKRTIGPIRSALENGGFTEPHELALMDPLKLLTNRTVEGKYLKIPVPLVQHAQLSLENLKNFIIFKMMNYIGFGYNDWMELTHMDLMRFNFDRVDAANRAKMALQTPLKSPPKSNDKDEVEDEDKVEHEKTYETPDDSSVESDEDDRKPSPLVSRRKHSILNSIKRDINAYKDFKEDRYYDSWIKIVKANAKLHGVSKVLDKDYIPKGEDAIDEFEDMQTYMWAIVVNTVKTPTGKQLIREHDGDAQTIFAKLHQELKTSQKAEHSADDLHDKIKALSLSKWPSTYVSFLENFASQLFLWCELVAGTRADPDDGEKKKMLKTAVSSVPVMASIATQEGIDIAKGRVKWMYNVYFDIFMRQAIDDDRAKNPVTKAAKTTTTVSKAKRAANKAEKGRGGG